MPKGNPGGYKDDFKGLQFSIDGGNFSNMPVVEHTNTGAVPMPTVRYDHTEEMAKLKESQLWKQLLRGLQSPTR
jgi:hypothetical protein